MNRTDIPTDKTEAVERALNAAFGTATIDFIEVLDGGYSSALNYKIAVKGKPYVLKIIKNITPLNDPQRRFACMKLAADDGIAPKVHYTHSSDAVSIVEYIDAKSISSSFDSPRIVLKKLAALIHNIHSLPEFPPLINFLDGVRLFINQFKDLNMLPEALTSEFFTHFVEIQKYYPRHEADLVASHNDLHSKNMLFNGENIKVIDWEGAFQNDRYVDLAIVAKSFATDAEQEKTFLKYYFNSSLNEYILARFFLMQQVCHIYYAMPMFIHAASMKPVDYKHTADMNTVPFNEVPTMIEKGDLNLNDYEGKLLYGKVLLNEALKNMRRTKFNKSIELMKHNEKLKTQNL